MLRGNPAPGVARDLSRPTANAVGRPSLSTGLLVFLLALAASLAACAPSSAPDDTLERGVGPEPESLDPHRSRTTQAHTVQRDLFEGLLGYSPSGELVNAAAERFDVSADGRTYTFFLRPDARWSNGDPLTAGDFVYSFRRLVAPATAAFYAEHLVAIDNAAAVVDGSLAPAELGVAAAGERELVVRLAYPVPYFPQLLALPGAYPVHRGSIEQHGEQFTRPGKLVSNGAYRLADWQLGAFIELERNPQYWNAGAVTIPRVRHHVTAEESSELYRYRAGELDITQTVPPEAYAQLREERPDELRVARFLGTYFYGLNLGKAKLAEQPALRQALSMAIDRELLTDKVTARGEQPAWSWVPPGVANYEPPRFAYAELSRAERHAIAKRLYREAGYGPDSPLELEIRYNSAETHEQIALAVQSMWLDVLGFEATLVNEEFRVLVSNIREGSVTEVFRLSWNGDYNDANSFLSMFETGNASNLPGYSNPSYDRLLESASRQTDPGRRRLFLEEAEQTLLSDHPVIPLYFHVSKHLVSPRVRGWQDNVLDFHYSQHLSLRDADDE